MYQLLQTLMSFLQSLWEAFVLFIRGFQKYPIRNPENHLILITGCDSGFGLLTTQKLLKLKYSVAALCFSEKGVKELEVFCKENGYKNCTVLKCDVTNEKDIHQVYVKVEGMLKNNKNLKLWALINNAGIAPTGYTDWVSMDAFRRTMEVNYFAIVSITKQFLKLLKSCKHSRIINICSMAGQIGIPHGAPYCGKEYRFIVLYFVFILFVSSK
jgi:NAD(P)-dependent dehydrogenase (short-subunit alcohol dehydrogenase family)